jgi:periplasmic protein TonB
MVALTDSPLANLSARTRRQSAPTDGLSTTHWRVLLLGIVTLHLGAVWAVLQVPAVREAVQENLPMFVRLVPPLPKPATIPALPPPTSAARPTPTPQAAPKVSRSVAQATTDAIKPLEAPAPKPAHQELTPPMPPATINTPPTPPAPAAANAPAPRHIPASEVAYVAPPVLVYPEASRDNRESGSGTLRVEIDEEGKLRSVVVSKSSGFARLDKAAMAATKKARFKPYTFEGKPATGFANIPFEFKDED